MAEKEQQLEDRLNAYAKREAELAKLEETNRRRAEEISGMTAEEAKKMLLESLEQTLRQEQAGVIRRVESETRELAAKKARQIITLAIQKSSTEQVSESTCSVLTLPSEDVKGRIIGREGRNIRALEAATGVNLIIDDTPEAVVLSCFDPLRREIARLSLEKLLADGRILQCDDHHEQVVRGVEGDQLAEHGPEHAEDRLPVAAQRHPAERPQRDGGRQLGHSGVGPDEPPQRDGAHRLQVLDRFGLRRDDLHLRAHRAQLPRALDIAGVDVLSFGGRIAYETHLAPLLRMQGHVHEIALDLVHRDALDELHVLVHALGARRGARWCPAGSRPWVLAATAARSS